MTQSREVKKLSKFAIVNAVVVALNLGDYGKVENFVQRTAKALERESETIDQSIANAKHNLKTELRGMNDDLEDAQTAVEEAYTSIDPKDLKDNAAQRVYKEIYLEAIDKAEGLVLGFEEKITKAKEVHKEKLENLNKQKAIRTKRIARLTKGVVK